MIRKANNTDLYLIAAKENISILPFPMPDCESLSLVKDDDSFVIGMDYKVFESTRSEREHIAHELGHCMSGAVYTRYQDRIHKDKAEYSATKWAVHNLIDRDEFISLLKQGYRVWELADEYNVTEDFIKKAYHFYCELEIA